MGNCAKSLKEYAAEHPAAALPADDPANAAARIFQDLQAEREQAEELKDSIAQQIQQGNAPEFILYTALNAIGLLTADEAWAAKCKAILNSIYSDLAQQSLLTDNAAIAAQRLEEMHRGYTNKTRAQLQRKLSGCKRLSAALNDAINAIDSMKY